MNVDREIDALYSGPPEEFVSARDDLAKRLKAADRGEDAAAVKALRRPTVAAWALNRLAHERPGSLGPLMELATELRRAQRGALSGLRGAGLREAVKRRRAVVDRIADEAIDLLEAAGRSGETQRDAVARTLQEGPKALPDRTFVVASTREEAITRLRSLVDGADAAKGVDGRPSGGPGRAREPGVRPVFLFPGQGSQFPGMAAG
ncbi:MAG: hypothetical protein WD770_05505, partial [Actinomycetota bacterium]